MKRDAGPVKRKNLTEHYRNNRAKLEKEFQAILDDVVHYGVMVHRYGKKYTDRPELFYKTYGEWESITWGEMSEIINAVSAALIEYGIREEERIGIYSANRPEWHLSDLGSLCIRAVTVPVYPTNSTKETEYIVNDAGIRVLFVSRQEQYDRAYPLLDICPSLEHIVVFHRGVKINTGDSRVIMWDDLLEMGRRVKHTGEIERRLARCHYKDTCTIIYTSGTTGEPKGVVHTFIPLIYNDWAIGHKLQEGLGVWKSIICMLPLSHVFERSWDYGVMQMNQAIYYCEDHNQILDILKEANPTMMNSAPRMYEKIYSTVQTGVQQAPAGKQKIFRWATGVGAEAGARREREKRLTPWLWLRYKIADKLVLHKIRDLFGKNIHHVNAGGAPISSEIARFFFNAGISICSGYGLTETAPGIAMAGPRCNKFGSVGPVAPLVDLCIDADTGEIQVKGPNLFTCYYNKPEQTKSAFTSDGWFKTGDVGHLDEDGYLFITDRIKDLIITSGGKNIAPQMIEMLMSEDFYIEYIAVIGNARKYITALIVPSFTALEEWARKNSIAFTSREDLVTKKEVIDFYREIIDRRQSDLGRVEQIKKFTLLPGEFSQENGEITPTMKVKRKVIEKRYADLIESMYADGDLSNLKN